MSLTSFLNEKDVRDAFKQEFKKPRFKPQAELLAPPLTNHYGLVGTAFDYLLRFYIKRLNPAAVEHPWVSEACLNLLEIAPLHELFEIPDELHEKITENPALADPAIYKRVAEIIQYAKKVYSKHISTGMMNSDLFKAALLLAQVDVIYRAGIVDQNFGNVDKNDIKDLQSLISIVKPKYFKAKKICILNPTFGKASILVGGADCDLVIDDAIIDIKTTKRSNLARDYFDQLIGYYILYKIGGIDGMPSNYEIKRLGIYFSRYAYLLFIDVRDVIKEGTFPNFVKWFKKRAREEYEAHL